jgi:hypothetical protein
MGLIFIPRRTLAAFVRGRNSQSLYTYPHDTLLDITVAAAREMTGVDKAGEKPNPLDLLALGGWWLFSLFLAVLQLALLCAPVFGLVYWVI